ncbi:hypothetical protein EMIHUDRAFT_362391 [Emiliania huxleyi CCMP1516]|uniref:Guanylate cyclase domain-containing protein n=2 Tax=Emiliania huxleyi TaxID=2903 RepID=A0A0D3KL33_EMIH1|nr:hypothetical protein EMIHUDRAFT_362391 [Emiliania huxleyi CCMP1516]EOD36468.1 hypothetical protein EMIHUDRAFT_362391 [Emiliania huxleyi CCMP1516]|eukprot:XP_005788897.1 hypothetical protein EMIHUDRAFT_362391 [Emiliania huxleyi CCMP1516]
MSPFMSLGTTPAVAPRRPTGGKPAPPRGQPRPATSSRRTRRRRRRPCSKPATARCAASWRATAGSISTSADWNAATGRAEASCSSGGGGGGDLPDRAERVERISRGEFGTVQPSARRAGFDRPVRKTANEQYLVAAGLPDPTRLPDPHDRAAAAARVPAAPTPPRHTVSGGDRLSCLRRAGAQAGFGFAIINVMTVELRAEAPRAPQLTVQVGIDFGSAIAGVIGHKTYQYDLCGDAVNTAARMCSGSEPGRVHVSQEAYRYLRGRFGAKSRGPRYYKGKGEMYTYFLENAPGALPEEATPAPADAAEAIY